MLRFWLTGSSPAWSPDGGRIAFLRDGNLFAAPVGDPDAAPLTDGLQGVRAPAWSPDGATVAVMASASGSPNVWQDVWLVPAEGGEPRQLTSGAMTADEVRFGVSWSPDGATVAYVAEQGGLLGGRHLAGGGGDRNRASIDEFPARHLHGPGVVPRREPHRGAGGEEGAVLVPGHRRPLPPRPGRAGPKNPSRCRPSPPPTASSRFGPGAARGSSSRTRSAASTNVWSVAADGGRRYPGDEPRRGVLEPLGERRSGTLRVRALILHRRRRALHGLGGGRPGAAADLASPVWEGVRAPREISYRSFDGHYVQGFLYLPEAVEEGAVCPALAAGPRRRHEFLPSRVPNLTEQYLASRGFVVLAVNYRGGSGFGREFQDLGDEDWPERTGPRSRSGGRLAAGRGHRERQGGDLRLQLRGHAEHGGHHPHPGQVRRRSADWRGSTPSGRPSSTRTGSVGSSRWTATAVFPRNGPRSTTRPRPSPASGTSPRRSSSSTATRDVRAPFLNFELAVAAFEEHGIEYEAHTYPEGHGFRDPDNRIALYRRVEEFFRRHLGACR